MGQAWFSSVTEMYDLGFIEQVFTCTGALATTVARARALLWFKPQGGPANSDKMFPTPLTNINIQHYDWELHSVYTKTLQLPNQNSLLHASLCVPLMGLANHGRLQKPYREPDYPLVLLEPHIPVPGATYRCAREQQCFVYRYVESMRSQLPGCTALGSPGQRQDQNLRGHERAHGNRFREYSELDLSTAAFIASKDAMQTVRDTYASYPIMGVTLLPNRRYQDERAKPNRWTSTDVYDFFGHMMYKISPCDCNHCRSIHNSHRFAHKEALNEMIRYPEGQPADER